LDFGELHRFILPGLASDRDYQPDVSYAETRDELKPQVLLIAAVVMRRAMADVQLVHGIAARRGKLSAAAISKIRAARGHGGRSGESSRRRLRVRRGVPVG
jgi:hypothetical protein